MTEVNLTLFPSQIKALQATEKQILMLVGRGYGKSYINALWILMELIKDPGSNCLLVSPTYAQSKEVVSYMSKHCDKIGLEYSINKVPDWCRCPLPDCKNVFSINVGDKFTYCRIGSADNEDNLRGGSYSRIAVDEVCYCSETLYDAILLPMLRGRGSDFHYKVFMSSSPAGASQSWVYRRFIEKPPVSTLIIQAPSYENFVEWNDEKISYYKENMSDRFFQQEIEAKCLEWASNQVFYSFNRESHLKHIDNPDGRFYIACDMNVDGLSSICGFANANNIHIDREVVIKENGNAQKMAAEFHKIYSHRQNKSLYMTGDRSTKSRSAASITTYHQQLIGELRRLGWNVTDKTLNANPSQFDSAEMVCRRFEKNELTIDPLCKTLIDDCVRGAWKSTLGDKFEIDKALCRFDCGDCLRYLIWEFRPGSRMTATNSLF